MQPAPNVSGGWERAWQSSGYCHPTDGTWKQTTWRRAKSTPRLRSRRFSYRADDRRILSPIHGQPHKVALYGTKQNKHCFINSLQEVNVLYCATLRQTRLRTYTATCTKKSLQRYETFTRNGFPSPLARRDDHGECATCERNLWKSPEAMNSSTNVNQFAQLERQPAGAYRTDQPGWLRSKTASKNIEFDISTLPIGGKSHWAAGPRIHAQG